MMKTIFNASGKINNALLKSSNWDNYLTGKLKSPYERLQVYQANRTPTLEGGKKDPETGKFVLWKTGLHQGGIQDSNSRTRLFSKHSWEKYHLNTRPIRLYTLQQILELFRLY